jgi:hypothetical protein
MACGGKNEEKAKEKAFEWISGFVLPYFPESYMDIRDFSYSSHKYDSREMDENIYQATNLQENIESQLADNRKRWTEDTICCGRYSYISPTCFAKYEKEEIIYKAIIKSELDAYLILKDYPAKYHKVFVVISYYKENDSNDIRFNIVMDNHLNILNSTPEPDTTNISSAADNYCDE